MKKRTNKFYLKIFLFIFFCISFSSFPIKKVAGLEIEYPPVTTAGQSAGTVSASDLPGYIKYLFIAGVSLGFSFILISLVVAGVMYIFSAISPEARANAKDRISGAISGLLILVLSYLVITTINPQLNIFTLNKLKDPNTPKLTIQKSPGVYFCKDSGCSGVNPVVSSVPDFGPLKNKISYVNIVQDVNDHHSYITILYGNNNYWGSCQYFNGSSTNASGGGKSVTPFAASASVYEYDYNSNQDGGVYFFRKSCMGTDATNANNVDSLIEQCKKDGYYMVTKPDTYELKSLNFDQVPEEEKDCEKYDKNLKCTSKKPPTLAGDNISSVVIKGNYLVLFFYFGANDEEQGMWTSCQEFPSLYDANRMGPRQMKWEIVRNSKGLFPNWVAIIPIKAPAAAASSSAPTLTPIAP